MTTSLGRRVTVWVLVLAGLVAAPWRVSAAPVAQPMDLCTNSAITTDRQFTQTLTVPPGDYVADCALTVAAGATVNIPAGVNIAFGELGTMRVEGRLEVSGAQAGDVTFTSDDAVKAKGQWRGMIVVAEASADIRGLSIRYGGVRGASMIEASGPISISNSSILDGEGNGIDLRGVNATLDGVQIERMTKKGVLIALHRENATTVAIRNSSFRDITEAAVESDASVQLALAGNSVRDAAINGVSLKSGVVERPLTFVGGDMPYVIAGNPTFKAPVTVEAGAVLKFNEFSSLRTLDGGSLIVAGEEGNPAYFTTITDDEACLFAGEADPRITCDTGNDGDKARERGAWNRVQVFNGSLPGSIRHAVMRYGDQGMLSIEVQGYVVENLVAEKAKRIGVAVNNEGGKVEGTYFTMRNSTISDNTEIGLELDARGPYEVSLEGNTFSENTIAVDAKSDVELMVSGNTSEGEGLNGYRLSGDMTIAHEWRAGDLPFVPAETIKLTTAGTTLTVQAGAVVKSLANGAIDVSRGHLAAGGEGGARTLFTSVEDDACSSTQDDGCDTNGDGAATSGRAGDWQSITIPDISRGAMLRNVEIRNGGRLGRGQIVIESGNVSVLNSSIHHGEGPGLFIELANPTIDGNEIHSNGVGSNGGAGIEIESKTIELKVGFTNNRIYNNNGGAVEIDANVELALDGTNSTDEPAGFDADPRQNQLNGIVVDGTMTRDTVWRSGNLPFVVQSLVRVDSTSTLTLEPGVRVKFGDKGKVVVSSGTIHAVGTEDAAILLTSIADPEGGETLRNAGEPRPGDWPGLDFGLPGVDQRTVRLEYVNLRYAGAASAAAIRVAQDDVVIANCEITDAAATGIHIDDAEGVQITDNVLRDIREDAIRVETEQGLTIDVRNNTIENSKAAVHIDANVELVSEGNTVTDNDINGVLVSDDVTKIRTWGAGDLIYVLNGKVGVNRGTLKILPGVVIKGSLDSVLTLQDGNLDLTAAADGPGIVLTSLADDTCGGMAAEDAVCDTDGLDIEPLPGDWGGIRLEVGGDSVRIQNIKVLFAGGRGADAAIDVGLPNGVQILDSEIARSAQDGILLRRAKDVIIRGNLIRDNLEAGIKVERDSSAVVEANIFTGNVRPAEIGSSLDIETSDNVSVGNDNDALLFSADISTSQTWRNDFVREVDRSVNVLRGAALVIEPGNLVRFGQSAGLDVESSLRARGAVFSADQVNPEHGYWDGISYDKNALGAIKHSVFAFGGSGSKGAVHVTADEAIEINYNTFLRSDGSAISATGNDVDPIIEGNLIRDVAGRNSSGINLAGSGSRSIVSGNFIAEVDNGITLREKRAGISFNNLANVFKLGISNTARDICVKAEYNWWGDSRGPLDTHDPSDDRQEACKLPQTQSDGVEVTTNVDYMPWLDMSPPPVPVLDLPRSGYTNQRAVRVAGRAGPNETVYIFDADATQPIGQVIAGSAGGFDTEIDLSPGVHELSVESRKDGSAGTPEQLRSARTGFRLIVVNPDTVIDPSSVAFVYGPRSGPQVQPLRDAGGAAPRCGGPGSGRVVLPEDGEVRIRLRTQGTPTKVEFLQDGTTRDLTFTGTEWESAPFAPTQGAFSLRAVGDEAGACEGFIYLGGAGRVFSDEGVSGDPLIFSEFEGPQGSNDGWVRENPWSLDNTTAANGSWSVHAAYQASQDSSLVLAEDVNLGALVAPELHFFQKFDLGRGDRGYIEIQTEPNGRWIQVKRFEGANDRWHDLRVPLDEYAKEPRVKIRFRLGANSDTEIGGGWWLDDITIGPGGAHNGVYDRGEPLISGAEVRLEQRNPDDGRFIAWDGDATGQSNPQTTDESGRFAFFALPAGEYRLLIKPPTGEGLQPFMSNPPIVVVEGTLAMDIPLSAAGAIYMPYTSRGVGMGR